MAILDRIEAATAMLLNHWHGNMGCCIFLGILCLLRSDDTCSHWSSIPFFLLYNLQVNNSTISRLMTVHGR